MAAEPYDPLDVLLNKCFYEIKKKKKKTVKKDCAAVSL